MPSKFNFRNDELPSRSERTVRYERSYGQVPVLVSASSEYIDHTVIERLRAARKDLKNTKRREKRLRETVESLQSLLKDEIELKESLSEKLAAFKGTYMCY